MILKEEDLTSERKGELNEQVKKKSNFGESEGVGKRVVMRVEEEEEDVAKLTT